MKRTIVGQELTGTQRQQYDNVRSAINRDLLNFFPQEKIFFDSNRQSLPMIPNAVYFHYGSFYVKVPTPVAWKNDKLTIPRSVLPYRNRNTRMEIRKDDAVKERVIAFRIEGEVFYSAFFFLKSKTLMFHHKYDQSSILFVINKLVERGVIVPLPQKEAPVFQGKTMQVIEIHEGNQEVVDIPVPKGKVTIGCDPEFELVRGGRVVRPPSYYSTGREIGLDGAGSQIELRPIAGTEEDVISRMKVLMKRVRDPISTIGDTFPVGGHIHVGVGKSVYPTDDLLQLLDYFLGEPTATLNGRARGGYARMSAYEPKNWGFEYRTPPAAIFDNPEFTLLSLKICKNVVANYHNKRTFKITVPTPVMEDYMNYCGFTEEDYNNFVRQIAHYKTDIMTNKGSSYKYNIAHNWDTTISEKTDFGFKCDPYPCDNPECPMCHPDTWESAYNARIKREQAERDRQDALYAQEMERNQLRIREQNAQRRALQNAHQLAQGYNMEFSDDWNIDIITSMINRLAELNGGNPYERTLILYGLMQDRGMVFSGFDMEGYERVDVRTDGTFGIPRYTRMAEVDMDDIENSSLLQCMAEAIHNAHLANTASEPLSPQISVSSATSLVGPVWRIIREESSAAEEHRVGEAMRELNRIIMERS